jgi:biotin carboxyl carrier protein
MSLSWSQPLKWIGTAAGLAALLGLAYVVHKTVLAQGAGDKSENKSSRKDVAGEITVKAGYAEGGLFLEVAPARAAETWYDPVTVYGLVVPNPRATVEIRSPFAGTLREGGKPWPRPGQVIKAGEELGFVDIRVGPQDRLDLHNKLNEASLKHKGALETLRVKQTLLRRLEAAPQSVPLRELETARMQLSEAKTQEALAKSAVDLWQEALTEIDRPGRRQSTAWSQPLRALVAGEVTELAGQPGTSVEAGAVVMRLVDFRRPLIRLDLPPEALRHGTPKTVELHALTGRPPALRGARNQPQADREAGTIQANWIGIAPAVSAVSQLAGYLYEVEPPPVKNGSDNPSSADQGLVTEGIAWRPGLAVKAELHVPPAPDLKGQEAVSVPTSALLYHQGRALVYIQKYKDEKVVTFAHCEVQVLGRKDGRLILAANQDLTDQTPVVVRNAQRLLSEEFKQAGDDDD